MKKSIVTKTEIKNTNDWHYSLHTSLRGSGKIRKRTILGEKFDYGEKLKEKKNYIYYVSGQGQEKKEIEEIEQILPGKKSNEKIVEEKQIIDNYQYHESKNFKRKPNKYSTTYHERLSTPFERTKVRKYSSYTSEPKFAGYKTIKTTNIVDKNNFPRNLKYKNNYNSSSYKANSKNLSRDKSNSKVYETYISPKKNNNSKNIKNQELNKNNMIVSNNSRRISTSNYIRTTENSLRKNSNINKYRKNSRIISINYIGKEKEKYLPQQVVEYEYQNKRTNNENVPINGQISITLGNSKPEKRQVKNYIVKENIINEKIESGKFVNPKPRFGSRPSSRCERRPFGGPRLHFPGSQRPKSGNNNKRTLPLQRNTEKKKSYIQSSGQGFKVTGNISNPKPMDEISGGYIIKNSENFQRYKEYSSQKIETIEKKISYSISSQSNISSVNSNFKNIRSLKNNYSRGNKSFAPLTNYSHFEFYSPKFPGKGTRVGGSGLVKKVGLDFGSDSVSGSGQSVSYSEYKKYEQRTNPQGNNFINSNNYSTEENLDYHKNHEKVEKCREVFCPIHGKQLIRYTEC